MAGCPNEIQAVAATAMEAANDALIIILRADEHLHAITERVIMWRRSIVFSDLVIERIQSAPGNSAYKHTAPFYRPGATICLVGIQPRRAPSTLSEQNCSL